MSNNNIVLMSNKACCLLITGDYDRSIEDLSIAFETTRALVLEDARRYANGEKQPESNSSSSSPSIIDSWMAQAPEDISDLDSTSQYIYQSPIFIPMNAANSAADSVLLSVVAAFNLGLAFFESARQHHRAGATTSTAAAAATTTMLLRKALKLFQYAFRLQRARGKASQSPLFFMATVNNIGVLYNLLGEYGNANECFQQLLALFMFMNTNSLHGVSRYGAFLQNTTKFTTRSGKGNSYHSYCAGAGAA